VNPIDVDILTLTFLPTAFLMVPLIKLIYIFIFYLYLYLTEYIAEIYIS